MDNINWNDVEESQEFPKPVPDGYICKIMDVVDNEAKKYLEISYDIAKGQFKGNYTNLSTQFNYALPKFYRSYKSTALSFFKSMLVALEKSNQGFTVAQYNNDPQKLKGLYIGLVLGEEEYLNASGEVKTILKPQQIRSVVAIEEKNYKVPEVKRLKQQPKAQEWIPANDDTLPWE